MRNIVEELLIYFLAIFSVIACIYVSIEEWKPLSLLIDGPWEPLFIFMIATTGLSLFQQPNWRIPAIMILFVVAFSSTKYPAIHDLSAAIFFISSYISIALSKRYSWIALSAIFVPIIFFNLLIFEIIAITSIILFHSLHISEKIKSIK